MKFQNRWRMNIKALAIGFGITLFTCHPLLADDTEIFFGGASPNASAVHPNVLFVLDTSGSMTSTDITGSSLSRLDNMKVALHSILDAATNVNVGLMRFSNSGGPVLFPISYIDEDACNVVSCAASSPSIQARVSASNDDAEEDGSQNVDLTSTTLEMVDLPAGGGGTTVSFTTDSSDNDVEEYNTNDLYEHSSDLEFFKDGSQNPQRIGLRFSSVDIPATATVTGAYLQFTVDEAGSGTVSADIYGHAHANSPTFSTSGIRGVSDRIASEAAATKVDWDGIPNPSVGNTVTSPSIAAIVQEIRATSGWSDGNPMTFMIVKDPGMTSDSSNKRTFEAGENSSVSHRPTLVITYSMGGAGATNQLIGLRFADVQIPQGVTITSAVVEFEAASADSGAAALAIDIEAGDDAASFSDTGPDQVSDRTLSGTPVPWVAAAWTTPGASEQSPDITSLVQAVVSRAGWCGGNAMAVVIGGTGTRVAKSYDQTTGGAPVLKVTYDPDSVPAGGGCINKSIVKRVAIGTDDAEQNTSNNTVGTSSSDLEMMVDSADQFIGLRFQSLQIAQGATIINAYLQFTAKDGGSAGTIDMSIYGEDTDDATTFSTGTNNIGSRALTSAVDWVSSTEMI
ncbi:hypothetical protein MNBD_GAMMA26-78 [hydrothermal vent metagenome]|uniref:VWFA domain-containing protein n=1 Tax=hydrothermal vent metagenome TaxID=652676 RepID=A0A3B1AVN9_9ZZZZ